MHLVKQVYAMYCDYHFYYQECLAQDLICVVL